MLATEMMAARSTNPTGVGQWADIFSGVVGAAKAGMSIYTGYTSLELQKQALELQERGMDIEAEKMRLEAEIARRQEELAAKLASQEGASLSLSDLALPAAILLGGGLVLWLIMRR